MEEKILRAIYESLKKGEKVALGTITEENGSAPRKNGSIMAVWQDGRTTGSVGGGNVEQDVIAKAAVRRGAAYVGMIGSTAKTQYVMKNLMEEGIIKEELQKAYAPVGLDIASELPQEIAFGILSEILLVKNNGSLRHMRDVKNVWI
jgi:xanthine/CO dehydrogenase XdhC/CoxF family maturation factor